MLLSIFTARTVALLHTFSAREGDTTGEARDKALYLFWLTFSVAMGFFYLGYSVSWGVTLGLIASSSLIAVLTTALVHLRVTRRISSGMMVTVTAAASVAIATADICVAPMFARWWPLLIIVIDMLLVMRTPAWLSQAVAAWGVLLITLVNVEYSVRFGLFDMPGLISQEDRRLDQSCGSLPCKGDAAVEVWSTIPKVLIFLLDYQVTRGFAAKLRSEQHLTLASVEAAQRVATCLARFDLEAAEVALAGRAAEMPTELYTSLRVILGNLSAYRPYLPQSLLLHEDNEENAASAKDTAKPTTEGGGGGGGAGVDVRGSCSLQTLVATLTHSEDTASDTGSLDTANSLGSLPSVGRNEVASAAAAAAAADALAATPPVLSNLATGLRRVRGSLLLLATVLPGDAHASYARVQGEFVAAVLRHATDRKGIVDHFAGDEVATSFNAARTCPQHGLMAVRTAKAICFAVDQRSNEVRCSVSTGQARVGTLGPPAMRRACVVGSLPALTDGILRLARLLRYPLLCSHTTALDIGHAEQVALLLHRCTLDAECGENSDGTIATHPDLSSCSAGSSTATPSSTHGAQLLYEVIPPAARISEDVSDASGEGEWMYRLENTGAAVWAAYNEAGQVFHRQGAAPAFDVLARRAATPDLVQRFTLAVRGACHVNLQPVVRPL